MIIGILSGKGGTGKTSVAVNLAKYLECTYVDCDVEEPNGFIFMKPEEIVEEPVIVEIPCIDRDKCSGCGICSSVCMFNAIVAFGNKVSVFPKLCHSCGACEIGCNYDAITFQKREIGRIKKGRVPQGNITQEVYSGVLHIGEPMGVPVIKKLMKKIKEGMSEGENVIVDCAPGTSCNIVTTLDYVDFAIIVAEPTLFSLMDMKRTIKVLKDAEKPFAVIINKQDDEVDIIQEYCRNEDVTIISKIPFSKEIAELYSNGKLFLDIPEVRECMEKVKINLKEIV